MSRLERHQVWVYLAALVAGLALGRVATGVAAGLEALVWAAVAALLYVTFTQVALARLPEAVRDWRFLSAVLVGNFVLLPVVVAALLPLVGPDPAVRIGVLLVLLVPCTDWFMTFTHLAGGDTRRAIAVTPVNLLVQLALLPLYLWLFLGEEVGHLAAGGRTVAAVAALIAVPLLAAWGTQALAHSSPRGVRALDRLGRLPVPLVALVILLVAGSQVGLVLDSTRLLPRLLLVYGLFLAAALVVGLVVARLWGLAPAPARAVVFSLGTRNSFVVLPVALALPAALEVAVVVVVVQSLVELLGMIVYLRLVPRLIPPAAAA